MNNIKYKLEPNTFIKLPEFYKNNNNSSTEIRISCNICKNSESHASNIIFNDDNFVTPFMLCDLNYKISYNNENKDLKIWNVYKFDKYNNDHNEIIKLINKYKHYSDNHLEYLNKIKSYGICNICDFCVEKCILDNESIDKIICNHTNINYLCKINDEEQNISLSNLCLCECCYKWLVILHPTIENNFYKMCTSSYAFALWLKEHEKELIII